MLGVDCSVANLGFIEVKGARNRYCGFTLRWNSIGSV